MKFLLIAVYLFATHSMAASIWPNGDKLETFQNGFIFGTGETLVAQTNDRNLLKNAGFEAKKVDLGWSVSGGGTSAATLNAYIGRQAFTRTPTIAQLFVSQDSTLNAAQLEGERCLASIRVKTNFPSDLTVCNRADGANQNCITIDSAKRNLEWYLYEIPFACGGTSSGISVNTTVAGTGEIILDDAFVGPVPRGYFNEIGAIGPWIDYGPITITAVTTAPTKPTTRQIDKVTCRISGSDYECQYRYNADSAAGAAAGTGEYLFSLPVGVEIDETTIAAYTSTLNGSSKPATAYIQTTGVGTQNGANSGRSEAYYYGANRFRVFTTAEFASNGVYGPGFKPLTLAQNISLDIKFRGKGLSNKVTTYSQQCTTDAQCENEFVADIAAGGAVSNENIDFISGNCTNADPRVCTFNSIGLTVAMSCTVDGVAASASTSTTVSVQGNSATAKLKCTKLPPDFKAKNVITGTFKDVVTTPNSGKVVLCSYNLSSGGFISNQDGGCAASCTSTSPYTCTFTSGYWLNAPKCDAVHTGASGDCNVDSVPTTSSFGIRCFNTATGAYINLASTVICHGRSN